MNQQILWSGLLFAFFLVAGLVACWRCKDPVLLCMIGTIFSFACGPFGLLLVDAIWGYQPYHLREPIMGSIATGVAMLFVVLAVGVHAGFRRVWNFIRFMS